MTSYALNLSFRSIHSAQPDQSTHTVNPTFSWVYQTVQPSQQQVGFIRLHAYKPNNVGFIRLQAYKPNNVGFIRLTQPSQQRIGFIRPFMVKPTSKIRTSQPTDGFIRHPAKPSFIVGFSGCPTTIYVGTKT